MGKRSKNKPRRKLKTSKDKIVRTVQLQHEDGTPLDPDPEKSEVRMNKRKAKQYDKVVGRIMREKGVSEEEALNAIQA